MSEHIWCQENIAAYVAGGLDVTEGERLEEHLSDCGDCARGVEEAQALDRKLAPLFRAANPGPALEDRLIRALPSRQARRLSLSLSLSRRAKACLAVAAVFLLMALGAAITEFSDDEKVNVLVAKQHLDTGLIMKRPEDLFEMKQKSKADVPPRAIVDLKELKGRQLRIPRRVGEMITANELIDKDNVGVSAHLPEGYRAVGQRVDMESTYGGFASLPYSRVDVIYTDRRDKSKAPTSQVLLENVLVLDADKQSVRDDSGKAMPADVVTFALQPEDALKLDLARQSGSISIALRKNGDTTRVGNISATEGRALNLQTPDELAKEMREQTKADLEGWADRSAWSQRMAKLSYISKPPADSDKRKDGYERKLEETRASIEGLVRDQKQVQGQIDINNLSKEKLVEVMKREQAGLAGLNLAKTADADQLKKLAGEWGSLPPPPPAPASPLTNKPSDGTFISPKLPVTKSAVDGLDIVVIRATPPPPAIPGLPATSPAQTGSSPFGSFGAFGRPWTGGFNPEPAKKELAWNNAKDSKSPDIQGYFMPADDNTRGGHGNDMLGGPTAPNVGGALAEPVPSPFAPPAPVPSSGSPAFPAPQSPSAPPLPLANAPKATPPGESDVKSDPLARPDAFQKPNEGKPQEPGTKELPKVFDPPQPQPAPVARRVIIRTGELEFEIDSFDLSVVTIMKLINASKGGFVATINSEKLPNGKVRGSVVIRIPPEQLDGFVLDLRRDLGKVGELKNQRIGSQDITKQYSDLESRLRAARTMEERLLNIIKDGKGQIKDLLLAEKELGVWRTQIEEIEGELRYYGNLASLSTLTIKLYEKDIRSSATITESERVQAGLEVEDVEKVRKEALKAIEDVKGRVTRDELKQHSAGQFNAILNFEVSHEATGPTRDRLKQLGNMVRLQIDRLQSTEDGGPPAKNGKIERGPTQFQISIYNLANITPRESNVLRLAVSDVPGTYQKLREVIGKAKGHIVNAQLNEQDKTKINAQLDFNVRRASEAEILTALIGSGETLSRQVVRLPEGDNVTDSKVAFSLALVDADFIQPRETVVMRIVAADVKVAYEKLREALGKTKTKTRVLTDLLNDQDKRNITAQLDFTYGRSDEGELQKALDKSGETLSRQVTRLAESNNVTDAKVLARVELIASDTIQPRETLNIRIAADDLRGAFQKLRSAVLTAKARVINAQVNEQDRQNITAQIDFTYPRADEAVIQAALTGTGETLARLVTRLPESPAVTDAKVLVRVELLPTDALMPRESTTLTLAVADVPVTYETLRSLIAKVKGKVLVANINKEDRGNVTAQLAFTFPRGDEAVIQTALGTAGEALTKKVDRVLEPGNYTDTKMLAVVKLEQADSLAARETVIVKVAAVDVPASYQALRTAVAKAKGRITVAKLNEQDRSNITAHLSFDVPRAEEATLQALLGNMGETLHRQSNREQDSIKVTDTKIGFDLDLTPATAVPPRETTTLALEVTDVAAVMSAFTAKVKEANGRIVEPQIGQERDGKVIASATYDVPLNVASSLVDSFKQAGQVRVLKLRPDPQAPEGKLALGRIIVVVSSTDLLVPKDQGIGDELRKGLSTGMLGLSRMLSWLIVGVFFVLPLLLFVPLIWLGRKFLGVGVIRQAKPAVSVPQKPA